jgi:hypothetical protein
MGERRVRGGKGRVRSSLVEGKGEENKERKDNVEIYMG